MCAPCVSKSVFTCVSALCTHVSVRSHVHLLVSMCVHVCLCIPMCSHVSLCAHECLCNPVDSRVCLHMSLCVPVYPHAFMCVSSCIPVRPHMSMCVRVWLCIHLCLHVCVCICLCVPVFHSLMCVLVYPCVHMCLCMSCVSLCVREALCSHMCVLVCVCSVRPCGLCTASCPPALGGVHSMWLWPRVGSLISSLTRCPSRGLQARTWVLSARGASAHGAADRVVQPVVQSPGGWASAWRVGLVPLGVHVWARI